MGLSDKLDCTNRMGCYFHKAALDDNTSEYAECKQYSWDKRSKINCCDYIIENVVDSEVYRLPGSVNGQQFIIQNCKNSTLYILDHMNTVAIDDCTDCKIILGAVKGSVFLRDCKDSICTVACGQFRARDCRKLDVFLCCATRPVLESSSSIHFGCYQLFYKGLVDHFNNSNLSPFNNEWSNIHDFTPVEGEKNWCLLPDAHQIQDYIQIPVSDNATDLGLTVSPEKSIVPHTWGLCKITTEPVCLVTFFKDDSQFQRASEFIRNMKLENPECLLLLSKERELSSNDAEQIFKTSAYNTSALEGSVIGLQFSGPHCYEMCEKVASHLTNGNQSPLMYVSSDSAVSEHQVDAFFNTTIIINC